MARKRTPGIYLNGVYHVTRDSDKVWHLSTESGRHELTITEERGQNGSPIDRLKTILRCGTRVTLEVVAYGTVRVVGVS